MKRHLAALALICLPLAYAQSTSEPSRADPDFARAALAQRDFGAVLRFYDKYPPITAVDHYRKAIALSKSSRWGEAGQELQKAIDIDPSARFGTPDRVAALALEIANKSLSVKADPQPEVPAQSVATAVTATTQTMDTPIKVVAAAVDLATITASKPTAQTAQFASLEPQYPKLAVAAPVSPIAASSWWPLWFALGALFSLAGAVYAAVRSSQKRSELRGEERSAKQLAALREELSKHHATHQAMIGSLKQAQHPQMLLAHLDAFIQASEAQGMARDNSRLIEQLKSSREMMVRELARRAYMDGKMLISGLSEDDQRLAEMVIDHSKVALSVSADPRSIQSVFQPTPTERLKNGV